MRAVRSVISFSLFFIHPSSFLSQSGIHDRSWLVMASQHQVFCEDMYLEDCCRFIEFFGENRLNVKGGKIREFLVIFVNRYFFR